MRIQAGMIALGLALGAPAILTPASADSLSPWGVWSDGAQLRKGKQSSGSYFSAAPKPAPAYVGVPAPSPKPKTSVAALPKKPVELLEGGPRPDIAGTPPPVVSFANTYGAGTIVIDTSGRKLYYTISNTEAYGYPIAVGKEGFSWTGTEKVSRIAAWPDWNPPAEMRERKPELPLKMTGGIYNPLGAKAIYLGDTLYRIHGTNDAKSIGTASSSGCFRMNNSHVVHLAGLVSTGTTVHVLKSLPKNVASSGAKPGSG